MEENTGSAEGFQREGQLAFQEASAEETASASQAEEENQEGDTQSSEGESTQSDDKDIPFHEHPRWKQREDEWNERFNSQETRHQEELTKALDGIRAEFSGKREENAAQSKIPSWFGGTQEQWDAYRADRDRELKEAGESAVKQARETITKEQGAGDKAVKDATDFFQAEVKAIEGDKALNPTGGKIDEATAKKLLQTVLDNELVDSKGRWNYRAGWKILNGAPKAAAPTNAANQEKKQIAASTTSEGRAETKPSPYKTSADFKKSRPW